jgi:putative PIN family toxin of toxin-antitoxin system
VRLVLDTDVFVAAVRSPAGASAELVRRIRQRRAVMLATVPLFIEYEAVATRPEHLAAAGATRADVLNVLDVLATVVERVEPYFLWRPRLRDPDDEMVLEAAANGRADMIVSFNARDFGQAAQAFGIGLALPAQALKRL